MVSQPVVASSHVHTTDCMTGGTGCPVLSKALGTPAYLTNNGHALDLNNTAVVVARGDLAALEVLDLPVHHRYADDAGRQVFGMSYVRCDAAEAGGIPRTGIERPIRLGEGRLAVRVGGTAVVPTESVRPVAADSEPGRTINSTARMAVKNYADIRARNAKEGVQPGGRRKMALDPDLDARVVADGEVSTSDMEPGGPITRAVAEDMQRRRTRRVGEDLDAAESATPTEDLPTAQAGHQMVPGEVDVLALLAGGIDMPSPSVWPIMHGRFLFYAGHTNMLFGDSGTGKSLVMQHVAAETLRTGGRVLYIDCEDTAAGVLSRVVALGATTEDMARFRYLKPEILTGAEPIAGLAALLAEQFDLVVVDGVTHALANAGKSSDSGDDYTRWNDSLLVPLAEDTGAAVVTIDHVVKNKDARGGHAIGSGQKRASVSGVAYELTGRNSPAPGMTAELNLYVRKDRHGAISALSCHHGKKQGLAARIVIDSTGVTVGGPDILVNTTAWADLPDRLKETAGAEDDDQDAPAAGAPGPLDTYLADRKVTLTPREVVAVAVHHAVAGDGEPVHPDAIDGLVEQLAPQRWGQVRPYRRPAARTAARDAGYISHPTGDRRNYWEPGPAALSRNAAAALEFLAHQDTGEDAAEGAGDVAGDTA